MYKGKPGYERHKERMRISGRTRKRNARAAGLCGLCCHKPAAPGRYSCEECLEDTRLRMRDAYAEARKR